MPVKLRIPGLIVAFVAAVCASSVRAGEPVDFARDVAPILEAHCFDCHGADAQESGLRLDRADTRTLGGNSGPAIVPGKSGESLLIKAVRGNDEQVPRMPPEDPRLSAAEVEILSRWIDGGAPSPADATPLDTRRTSEHWSFQPLASVQPPVVKNQVWVRNPIDAFVLSRLEANGIAPAAEADRPTLLRRLHLDLIGLPPSAEEVDAYLADTSGDAYDRLVDRLLASPHYGERWGRHWLDLAHYADSNGYTIDGARSIWKYRDWVIDALNRDLPFDRFAVEQLAGDMLPGATLDQKIATGFYRNTLVNEEGGTDKEQFRVEAVVDRISTTGSAFLGLTLGCARCHDHKFDPISQREFYQVFALLNGADEPTLQVPSEQEAKEMPALAAEIKQAEERLAVVDANAGSRQAEWEASVVGRLPVDWSVLDITAESSGGATITRADDGSLVVSGTIPTNDTYRVAAALPEQSITAFRIEVLTHDSLPNGGPGLADNGNFVLSEISLALAHPETAALNLQLADAVADYSGEKGDVKLAIDGKRETGWNIYAAKDLNVPRSATFFLQNALSAASGRQATIVFDQNYEHPRYQIGRFRISVTGAERAVLALPGSVREALAVATSARTPEQLELLKKAYQAIDPERVPLAERIGELKQQRTQMSKRITTTLVMRERPKPRETFVHVRGDFLQPGAKVAPDVPAVLPPIEARGERPDRLDFARWIVDERNPLTPRVTVNRVWQQYFGQGLVTTENDFGLQGETPSHPELLDWLAQRFVAQDWSLKELHRLIVTSNTYRQSSHLRANVAATDPYNKLLARQQRMRLDAEAIRDTALTASGLLSREIGGPGVYPPQPEGIYRFTQQVKFWGESHGADRYRRGMYTYLWRSSPYPFLKTFDVPDAVVACTRRPRSNTPLQALTLANDRTFFEIAQGFAARLAMIPGNDQDRLRVAFRQSLTRQPSDSELADLTSYLDVQRASFAAAPDDAALVAPAVGAEHRADAAAWTMVARVLLNLDEFITRE